MRTKRIALLAALLLSGCGMSQVMTHKVFDNYNRDAEPQKPEILRYTWNGYITSDCVCFGGKWYYSPRQVVCSCDRVEWRIR